MKELQYYISSLYLALFSRKFYADLIANKKIFGIKYLLILSFIFAMPMAFRVKDSINNIFENGSIEENINYISEQFPQIKISDNKFQIDLDSNLSITTKSGGLVAIIDVENKINNPQNYKNVLVISEKSFFIQFSDELVKLEPSEVLKTFNQYFVIDSQNTYKLNTERFFDDLNKMLNVPLLLLVIFTTVFYSTYYLFSAAIYSFLVGILFVVMLEKKIFNFSNCLKIAIFTGTPVILLEFISILSGNIIFNYASLVYFITRVIYIHFAIESYKKFYL